MSLEEQKDIVKTAPHLAIFEEDCVLPKTKLRNNPMPAEAAYRLMKDDMSDEGNARMNLATFCQTYMEPEAVKLMAETLDTNAIDKSEYPQMAQMENRCVDIISDLWHGKLGETIGCSTVGSSEACQLAGMAMKFYWRDKATVAGIDINAKRPNLVISSGYQVCWEKFCVYWDVEIRTVPMDKDHLSLNLDTVLDYVDEYTIGIVAILGITYTGKFDDIKGLDAILTAYNKTVKIPVQIHVDAASGGLYSPFVQPELEWDFQLENVRSISTSGHKYGLVYPGIGWVLWKKREYLPERLIFEVTYLGGTEPTMAINFSRSGAQIVGQYYVFSRYGRKGLELVHQATARVAQMVVEGLKDYNIFDFYNEGDTIPVVAFALKPDKKWSLYELSDRLRMHGWQVPAYPMPDNIKDVVVLRFVFRADFSETMAEQLLEDMRMEIDYLERHVKDDAPGKNKHYKHGYSH
jgi:glutamate decarboxylase